ncbi:MAG: pyridoxamine 5'-phosphate oxidase family protein [Thermomicrobiales bacterium]|nr:pyridoxamine 5'-phosphate oxidase family protein [Thermomicrobiales bacterium]
MQLDHITFINAFPLGVVATIQSDGNPSAALIGMAATDTGEVLFCAKSDGRTLRNLHQHSRIAVVFTDGDTTSLQVEGDARIPVEDDLAACLDAWLAANPTSGISKPESDLVLLAVQPAWVRQYSVTTGTPAILEYNVS